jgi:murein DD-endopeptidase MepM/ murein hydrolase activator NlpD
MMTDRRGRLTQFALVLIANALSPGTQAVAQESQIEVTHQARALQPGEVVLLRAESPRPLSQLRATAFDREFPLFSDGAGLRWTGLVGIDLETKPGRYTVKLRGSDTSGKPVACDDALAVGVKRFPTRQLAVDEKFVTPPKEVLARIKEESAKVRAIFDRVTPQRYWSGAFAIPVPGPVISSFGKRSVYNGQPRSPHSGTDFRAATGTPVRTPNSGKVVLAAELYFSGNTVIIDHGLGLYSYFGHLSAFSVQEGATVESGEVVGKAGATGLVTGPHLHWSVRLVGTRVDPMSLLSLFSGEGHDFSPPPARRGTPCLRAGGQEKHAEDPFDRVAQTMRSRLGRRNASSKE